LRDIKKKNTELLSNEDDKEKLRKEYEGQVNNNNSFQQTDGEAEYENKIKQLPGS